MDQLKNEVAALADMVRENMQPEIRTAAKGTPDAADVLLLPKGMELKSLKPFLDEYKAKPDRRVGTVQLDKIQSFIDVTNRFKASASAIFAKAALSDTAISASLTTVFNYHPEGPENSDAAFIDHRAAYAFPLGKDFRFWLETNGKVMSQIDFALFLEERVMDIVSPNAGDQDGIENLRPRFAEPLTMLELSRDLELYSNETFKNKTKLSSGETELKFSSVHVDASGKPVTIPDFFVINIPIFDGGNPQRLVVRLRYRVKEATVVWWYDLYRIDRTLEAAFEEACTQVTDATALPLFVGAPEGARA